MQSFESGIVIGDGEYVDPLDSFSLTDVRIYKPYFTSKITVQVDLTEAHIETEEWATSFKKKDTKEEVLCEVFNNLRLKAL